MNTRKVYRTIGLAVVALCGAFSLHDIAAGPTPQTQLVCWGAAAATVTLLLLRPGPLSLRIAGAIMVVAGVVAYLVESFRPVSMVVLVPGVLLTAVGDTLARLSGELTWVRNQSQLALAITRQMEHADPADYHERPSRERALEALCLHPHYSSKDLGALLHVSSRTVDNYLQRWITLTGVDNRRQLVSLFEYHYLARNVSDADDPESASVSTGG